jgi:hypothetical protein
MARHTRGAGTPQDSLHRNADHRRIGHQRGDEPEDHEEHRRTPRVVPKAHRPFTSPPLRTACRTVCRRSGDGEGVGPPRGPDPWPDPLVSAGATAQRIHRQLRGVRCCDSTVNPWRRSLRQRPGPDPDTCVGCALPSRTGWYGLKRCGTRMGKSRQLGTKSGLHAGTSSS